MAADDLELLDRWRAGDLGAGNELFKRHFKAVYRFFSNKVIRTEVDDLVQETFLACTKSRDAFRKQSSFRTYLFAIAKSRLYRYWSARAKRTPEEISESSLALILTTVRTRLAREDELQWLLAALRTLPLEEQVLFELRYWEGFSDVDVAEIYGWRPATTRSRLFRLRDKVRGVMSELERSPPAQEIASEAGFDGWARSVRPGGV